MVETVRKAVRKIGIDHAIGYTIFARVLQAGSGIISIVFISKYLSKAEQGYYYTFGSLLAIQIFFELGLTNIITQYVAHEVAKLQWTDKNVLDGASEPLSRLASLLRFTIKWFLVIGIILVFVLIVTGYFFFTRFGSSNGSIPWFTPWMILSISTAASLFVSPLLAFIEGLGFVQDVARLRLFHQGAMLILMPVGLMLGLKLHASPVASLISIILLFLLIFFSSKRAILISIWSQLKEERVNYQKEIFPFQWKIAISWISGYFMYQLFNPVLFATAGEIVAGQMGMTLAALNGVLAIAISWVNTKVPLFSTLIARRDFLELDTIFNITVRQGSIICFCCLTIFLIFLCWLTYYIPSLAQRFLPLFPAMLLCITTFVNQLVSAFATYLRCHKKEPLLVFSLVLALLTAISTLAFGKLFGLNGIVISYTVLTVCLSLTWVTAVFKKMKLEWHQ